MSNRYNISSFKNFFNKAAGFIDWLGENISTGGIAFSVMLYLLFIFFIYRIRLILSLFISPAKPYDFDPGIEHIPVLFGYMFYDLLLLIPLFVILYLMYRVSKLISSAKYFREIRLSILILLQPVIVFLTFIHSAHLRLLFTVQMGVSLSVMQEFGNVRVSEIFRHIGILDYMLILGSLVLFWVSIKSARYIRVKLAGITVVIAIVMMLFSAAFFISNEKEVAEEISMNPLLFFLSDAVLQLQSQEQKYIPVKQYTDVPGLQIKSPEYYYNVKPLKLLPLSHRKWNIIFFVMESVGTRYIFDTSEANPVPMPFLRELSERSWFFKRHYTTSNISSKAVFSILSGLYDLFRDEAFGTRPDATVPTLYSFLGNDYDGFFVTPASRYWYFPVGLAKNSGIPEMHFFENLKLKVVDEQTAFGHYITRDELQTADFFIDRIDKAREPFMGIYVSFVAHYPYFDYGDEYRIVKKTTTLKDRYYNNLYLLDRILKRIYDKLESKDLLERTIIVIVGDHGQAFGHHYPNNYMHFRYSFCVNLHAPVIIYQPKLFSPRNIEIPTSHVDILPTLLDAMRIRYNQALLQGESLFQNRLKRRYIFFYGFEKAFSSLSSDLIKVHYSMRSGRTWAYNLKDDPGEKNQLKSDAYNKQMKALFNFTAFHDKALLKYNYSLKKGKDFNGQRHPSIIYSTDGK